jgi:hypothetical protein
MGNPNSKGACHHAPLPIEFVENWPRVPVISLLR